MLFPLGYMADLVLITVGNYLCQVLHEEAQSVVVGCRQLKHKLFLYHGELDLGIRNARPIQKALSQVIRNESIWKILQEPFEEVGHSMDILRIVRHIVALVHLCNHVVHQGYHARLPTGSGLREEGLDYYS